MWPFDRQPRKAPAGPPALTGLEQQPMEFRVKMLELRCASLEAALIELCHGIRANLDRIDTNTKTLDKNLHNLAAMTLRPPTNLLGGNKEPN